MDGNTIPRINADAIQHLIFDLSSAAHLGNNACSELLKLIRQELWSPRAMIIVSPRQRPERCDGSTSRRKTPPNSPSLRNGSSFILSQSKTAHISTSGLS